MDINHLIRKKVRLLLSFKCDMFQSCKEVWRHYKDEHAAFTMKSDDKAQLGVLLVKLFDFASNIAPVYKLY